MLQSKLVNSVGVTPVIIQTVPATKVNIVLMVVMTNKTSSEAGLSLVVTKSTGESMDIISQIPKFLAHEIKTWEGKLVLTAGDALSVVSTVAGAFDIISNYMEDVNT